MYPDSCFFDRPPRHFQLAALAWRYGLMRLIKGKDGCSPNHPIHFSAELTAPNTGLPEIHRPSIRPGFSTIPVKILSTVALLTLSLLSGFLCLPAAAQSDSEYYRKAAFLINLPQFIGWPDNPTPQLVIGIFGPDPFGQTIDAIAAGEKHGDQPIFIRRYTTIRELQSASCHVLFVSAAAMPQFPEILSFLAGSPILTVADTASFLGAGGMVSLINRDRHILVEINRAACIANRLTISAKLLNLVRPLP